MKYIVISGAGPVGLYMAIRLKQLGVENVVVIDPRAGKYNRPGTLNTSIFKEVEDHINQQFYGISPMTDESEMVKGQLYVEKGETENSLRYKVIDFFGRIQTDTIYPDELIELIGNVTDPLDVKFLNSLIEKILQVDSVRQHIHLPVTYSPSRHIKEVERQLYDIAKQLGVEISNQQFENLKSKWMEVSDTSENVMDIPCDLAVDATGQKRVLVTKVNLNSDNKPFQVEPVVDNPVKYHFIAYGKMSADDIELLSEWSAPGSLISNDMLAHTLDLENLRSHFGWTEFDEPRLHVRVMDSGKVCLYFETPPTLDSSRYAEWMDALIYLKTRKHMEFERVSVEKPTYNPFIVYPHKVTTPLYKGDDNTPPVFPIGDAQIEPHFEIGVGIESGMNRVDALLNAMTIENGEIIAIDTHQYAEDLKIILLEHETHLISYFENRQLDLIEALVIERSRHSEALFEAVNSADRDIIHAGLREINARLATELRNYPDFAVEMLYTAVRDGDFPVVRTLVENGSDVNKIYEDEGVDDITLLYLAIMNDHHAIARYLIKHDSDLHQKTNGTTLLNIAVAKNDEYIVRLLLEKKADVNLKDDNGFSPLHIAVQNDNEGMVSLLLSHNADVNTLAFDDSSALHIAASNGNEAIITELLDRGAKIDQQTYHGRTPLHYAAQHDAAVHLLLRRNADATIQDDEGLTALYQAVLADHLTVASKLIELGANVNQHYFDASLLQIAIENNNPEMVKLLLDNKADVNVQTVSGESLLYMAVSMGNLDIVQLLIEHGADVHFQKEDAGETLVQLAIIKAAEIDAEILSVLLQAGPAIPATFTENVEALLAMADEHGHKTVIEQVLKEKYQDPLPDQVTGFSALEYAVIANQADSVDVLLKEANFARYVPSAIDYARAMNNEVILNKLQTFKKSENWARLFAEKPGADSEAALASNNKKRHAGGKHK